LRFREALRLTSVLYRELVYFRMVSTSAKPDLAKLKRGVRWANVNLAMISIFTTAMLTFTSISPLLTLSSPDGGASITLPDALRASAIIHAAMMFTFTFMLCASASWIIQEYGLLKPLMHLPLSRSDVRLLALLTAMRETLLFSSVPVIYGAFLFYSTNSIPSGLVGASYGYASMFLALGASFALSASVARKRWGKSLRARLARAINTLTFVLCMASTFLISQLMNVIVRAVSYASQGLRSLSSLLWLLYPFSASEGVVMALSQDGFLTATITAQVYLLASLLAFDRGFMRFWRGAMGVLYVGLEGLREVEVRPPSKLSMRPCFGILIKDLKMAYRDPRTAYMLFTPVLAFLAFLPTLLEGGEHLPFFINMLFSVSSLMLIMASYQFLSAEGDMFWLLFANGIRRKDLVAAKAIACTLPYTALALSMGFLAWHALGEISVLLSAVTSILVAFSANVMCLSYLARDIGPETKMAKMSLVDSVVVLAIWGLLMGPYIIAVSSSLLLAAAISCGELGLSLLILAIQR